MTKDRFDIYVPAAHARHDVRPRSAIVGEMRGDHVSTHLEGGGASNVQTFEEKLHHAAGRRSANYPTSAIRGWRVQDLVLVGHARYDRAMRHWVVDDIVDAEAFAAWIGEEPPAVGGTDTLRSASAGYALSLMPAHRQAMLMAAHKGSLRDLADAVLGSTATHE